MIDRKRQSFEKAHKGRKNAQGNICLSIFYEWIDYYYVDFVNAETGIANGKKKMCYCTGSSK